jgi:hypothetical protein
MFSKEQSAQKKVKTKNAFHIKYNLSISRRFFEIIKKNGCYECTSGLGKLKKSCIVF